MRDYLLAIAIWCSTAKSISALQLARDLDCQYRTAYTLAFKLREAMASMLPDKLEGKVEVDGAYFGGHVRPENHIDDRVDRRLTENRSDKRQVVVVMRERKGRTIPFVFPSEGASVQQVRETVSPGATIYADEGPHWQNLRPQFKVRIVEHKSAYFWDGVHINGAEGYFSRLRRAEWGQHHHIGGKYLQLYAVECAWREDFRRVSNGEQFRLIACAALQRPPSSRWAGYWQRHMDRKPTGVSVS